MTTDIKTATASITASDALAAFEQCLVAVADGKDGRPTLTGVHVRANQDGLTFAAADGFQLIQVRVPSANPDRNEWSAILDAPALKDALAAIKTVIKAQRSEPGVDRAPITLEYAEAETETYDNRRGVGFNGSVALRAGLATIIIPTVSSTFPNYDQLIPPMDCHEGGRVAFNAGLMSKILAVASKYAGRGIVRQRVQEPKEPMRLDWKPDSESWAATAVLMPMFVSEI